MEKKCNWDKIIWWLMPLPIIGIVGYCLCAYWITMNTCIRIKAEYTEGERILNSAPQTNDIFTMQQSLNDQSETIGAIIFSQNDLEPMRASSEEKSFSKCCAAADRLAIERYSQKVLNERNRRGSAGRLFCPEVGIDVALFRSYTQSVCDATDSACWFELNGQSAIGDHNFQGFTRIKRMIPGKTIVYINDGYTVQKYKCIDKMCGHNEKNYFATASGTPLGELYPNSLMLYTCNDLTSRNITMVYLQPIQ